MTHFFSPLRKPLFTLKKQKSSLEVRILRISMSMPGVATFLNHFAGRQWMTNNKQRFTPLCLTHLSSLQPRSFVLALFWPGTASPAASTPTSQTSFAAWKTAVRSVRVFNSFIFFLKILCTAVLPLSDSSKWCTVNVEVHWANSCMKRNECWLFVLVKTDRRLSITKKFFEK